MKTNQKHKIFTSIKPAGYQSWSYTAKDLHEKETFCKAGKSVKVCVCVCVGGGGGEH